ncbi:hypothetical protein QBC32DRAFT_6862 [Pseudoneurospora amorphoporcata]|uniref:Uncharacterized protein n=1 Tax=Pseudoneurospora amorphoporcata TaxID=241081 RepID=A0AAN6NTG3_9PEZI|nr:hypothetical protein QBC32DRAFT_6862 [Pseudoneurospora amorphoporcata]
MTNLGSLTTTFTPPASCTTNTPQIYQVWKGSTSEYIHGPLYTTDSNCFPDGYDANPTNYYNPGFCPKGYTVAPCSRSGLPATETEAASETRTAVVCCPSGAALTFTCADNTAQALACTTTFPKGAEVQMGVTIVSDGTTGAHTIVSERRGGIGAYGIQVVFGAMPDGRIPVAGPSETPTATNLLSTTPQPAITDPSAATTSSSSGGVSTGAAIGIGVGSAAFALIAAGSVGLFFFTRWRRKKRLRRRGTPGTVGTRSSKGGGGGGLSSRNGPPVPPKDMQPHYELSEEACSYVAASTAASDLGHHSSRHMSMFSDSRSTGTSGATPPPGQPAEPERAHLSPVWQSPIQSPSHSPGPSRNPSQAYGYDRSVEHPGHQFAELEAVVPMEAASSDMPSSTEPSLMIPNRWQSLQNLKSRTGSPTTTNLQDLPEGGTISSTMTGTGAMESVTNSWASRGRYGERGMSPTPWI